MPEIRRWKCQHCQTLNRNQNSEPGGFIHQFGFFFTIQEKHLPIPPISLTAEAVWTPVETTGFNYCPPLAVVTKHRDCWACWTAVARASSFVVPRSSSLRQCWMWSFSSRLYWPASVVHSTGRSVVMAEPHWNPEVVVVTLSRSFPTQHRLAFP